ncbi:MAG: alanine racemase [Bifidobacteriaceae bacterium]|jgi:alanine racemase|nr:alanine racemase [Bifidobacteriaceae bacterium]
MVEAKHRDTWIEISKRDVQKNVQLIREKTHASTIFFTVKANAYGYGLLQMAKACAEADVEGFACGALDEGLLLRENGYKQLVLMLGITPAKYAKLMAENDIISTVSSVEWLLDAHEYLLANGTTSKLKVSLAADTGMGRIGFTNRTCLENAINFLLKHQNSFEYLGINTHFSEADSVETDYFHMQLARWHKLTDGLPMPPLVHVANSGAAIYHTNHVPTDTLRIGTGILGMEPSEGTVMPDDYLAPVISLHSRLTFVKHLPAGEGISYAHEYTTQTDEWIGTLPIGYGDGWLNAMTGFQVLVGGEWAEIVGKIAMDQMMIRMPHEFPVGEKVTLIGTQGTHTITLSNASKHAKLPPWEFTSGFQDRIHRVLVVV